MSSPGDYLNIMAEELTINAIRAEVINARTKFPSNKKLLAALGEEYGELCKALMQDRPRDEIEREAIQVAAVAVRILEEGDADFENKDWDARS